MAFGGQRGGIEVGLSEQRVGGGILGFTGPGCWTQKVSQYNFYIFIFKNEKDLGLI